MHAGGDQAQLEKMIARLHELRKEHGKDSEPFEIHAASFLGMTVDGLKQLEDLGVTDAIVGFRVPYQKDTMSLDQKLNAMRFYADNVLSKFR